MDNINDHCVLAILKCLSVEELNSVVVVLSSRYNELRNHDSLDQTRTGTIVCTENTTLESIRNAFVAQEWNQVFSGNRTRLKIVGLERMADIDTRVPRTVDFLLPNVSCLDISVTPSAQAETREISSSIIADFVIMLPNLQEIDLDYRRMSLMSMRYLVVNVSACRKLKWNTSKSNRHGWCNAFIAFRLFDGAVSRQLSVVVVLSWCC